ncbi:MAG: glutamine synthetase [Alphaproteobacteria bacterium]|nr:glutamine synthetase [Alphaproteobacteria bacterium]
MPEGPIRSAEDAAARVRDSRHDFVKVALTDMDGLLRGKFMHRDKFLNAIETGFGFCDVVLGWDINDQLYDNISLTGWHTGFPDAQVRIIPETGRQIPFEDDCWLFLAAFEDKSSQVCPRGVLTKVLERASEMGFETLGGFEFEFFVFEETTETARAKNYQNMTPLAPGNTGYSLLRQTTLSALYTDIFQSLARMQVGLEGIHEEMGPGVIEASIQAADGLAAAEKASLFKTYTKAIVQNRDLLATFMAKWSAKEAGQSGHFHLSLTRDGGTANAFHDPAGEHRISATMRHFIAGQQSLMPELTAIVAPTVNSYRRLVPGLWAPTDATWGIDNRTCAIRVLPGSPKSHRLEYRVPGADANPYLVAAAAIASGLYGVENNLEPTDAVSGNAYALTHPENLALPRNLPDAASRFAGSAAARDWFGDAFVDHFAATRDWEARQLPMEAEISTAELDRYFELI